MPKLESQASTDEEGRSERWCPRVLTWKTQASGTLAKYCQQPVRTQA